MDAAQPTADEQHQNQQQGPKPTKKTKKLDCIDTFSGIGGIALGLREFTHTVQYCEWDTYCQHVLTERMEEGRLDRAPIHADIKHLHVSPRTAPRMISGGFPCQDISCIGLQKGIVDGERSSMFFHMMRIVDECPSIDVVFLENVANIVNVGLKEVVDELVRRGFDAQWKVYTASEFGAPHVRARWFCLATRNGIDLSSVLNDGGVESGPSSVLDLDQRQNQKNWWSREREPRRRATYKPVAGAATDETYDPNWIQRCHTLGNTVVPQVVRAAFVDLATASTKWAAMAACMAPHFGVPWSSMSAAAAAADANTEVPDNGLVLNGVFYAMPRRPTACLERVRHGIEITLHDGATRLLHFPTPRRGITHASAATDRAIRDLPTVLVHCDQTRALLREDLASSALLPAKDGCGGMTADVLQQPHSFVLPSVNYVEWMMGFERDWTRVAVTKWRYSYKSPSSPVSSSCAPKPHPHQQQQPGHKAVVSEEHPPPDAAAAAAVVVVDNNSNRECAAAVVVDDPDQAIDAQLSRRTITTASSAANRRRRRGGSGHHQQQQQQQQTTTTTRLNGLHMLMRDLPGKDIRTIAAAWKALTDDERRRYSDMARALFVTSPPATAATASDAFVPAASPPVSASASVETDTTGSGTIETETETTGSEAQQQEQQEQGNQSPVCEANE